MGVEQFCVVVWKTPCSVRKTLITFTRPICGRVEVDGGRINIYKGEGDCYKQCVEVWEWCWCDCIPGSCWEKECETPNEPRVHYDIISFSIEGSGNCDDNGWPPPPDKQQCTLIHWSRECGEKH